MRRRPARGRTGRDPRAPIHAPPVAGRHARHQAATPTAAAASAAAGAARRPLQRRAGRLTRAQPAAGTRPRPICQRATVLHTRDVLAAGARDEVAADVGERDARARERAGPTADRPRQHAARPAAAGDGPSAQHLQQRRHPARCRGPRGLHRARRGDPASPAASPHAPAARPLRSRSSRTPPLRERPAAADDKAGSGRAKHGVALPPDNAAGPPAGECALPQDPVQLRAAATCSGTCPATACERRGGSRGRRERFTADTAGDGGEAGAGRPAAAAAAGVVPAGGGAVAFAGHGLGAAAGSRRAAAAPAADACDPRAVPTGCQWKQWRPLMPCDRLSAAAAALD